MMNPAVVLTCLNPQVDIAAVDTASSSHDPDENENNSKDISNTETSFCVEQSTNYKFSHELGRRFHQFGSDVYWLPNDGQEINRLDLQHLIWRLTLGGQLYLPPLPLNRITKVLDVGTGTGAWAIDFAKEHPSCSVIGTDLSPIQTRAAVPSNCQFIIANAEEPWQTFLKEEDKFDLVHNRHLLFGIHDWIKHLEQAWTVLKHGGWIQMIEPVFPFNFIPGYGSTEDGPLIEYSRLCQRALSTVGIDTQKSLSFGQMLADAGWSNIETRQIKWPLGAWPLDKTEKELGKMNVSNLLGFLDGSAKLLWTKNLGWTASEVDDFLEKVKKDIADPTNTYYFSVVIAWAQKL